MIYVVRMREYQEALHGAIGRYSASLGKFILGNKFRYIATILVLSHIALGLGLLTIGMMAGPVRLLP